ncbi:hypothetical protein [Humisphaera borealis]|uniref:Uncharacterized protein n=1 Tax=Humisphaera borealis TaxID=2807512 RepID=A0A7M2X042_9BACT|nr:hypothetical protein [Humisphaera borealis]QOV91118.1 hypothetical protein IPV69_07105 [Humisphaera borealis]
MEHRRWVSAGRTLSFALLAVVIGGCCAKKPAPPPVVLKPKPPEAWIKADAFCILPLSESVVPPTGGQLADSMLSAWIKAFTFPDAAKVVTLIGGRYPAIDVMRVDLSDAVAIPKAKRPSVGELKPSVQSLWVSDFSLVAEPLRSKESDSQANMQITASGVRFDVQKSKDGMPLLMMADAGSGTLHFDTLTRDLEKSMLTAAKERGSRGLVSVRNISLDFKSVGPRSIDAVMHVSTLVGFIPAGMKFTARVDIDDQMNATIYNLTAEGDEALGPLIVQFIRPSLAKYDGKTKPLMSFPNPEVKLKDVQISAGERITLDAVFGK